jgi:hypothetical protein
MKKLGILLAVVGLLAAAAYRSYRHKYPFGMRHCCDSILYMALCEYAQAHGGAFPAGEATPEASMSLIHSLESSYGTEYAYVLCGHSRPESVVQDTLRRGELLGPDTCGWNYVEGLRMDSDSRLALFWDKEGLGHMGERLSGGGHIVSFVSGKREQIPASEWDGFLEEQQKLLAAEKREQRQKRSLQNNDQPQGAAATRQPGG